MSARLVLAVAIPSLALAVAGSQIIAAKHADVRKADRVREQVQVLDELIDLRASLFAERVAWEIRVPQRRPPDGVLATTDFGRLMQDQSNPLEVATDRALAQLTEGDRPFDPAELSRIRSNSAQWSHSPELIRARLEPLTHI